MCDSKPKVRRNGTHMLPAGTRGGTHNNKILRETFRKNLRISRQAKSRIFAIFFVKIQKSLKIFRKYEK